MKILLYILLFASCITNVALASTFSCSELLKANLEAVGPATITPVNNTVSMAVFEVKSESPEHVKLSVATFDSDKIREARLVNIVSLNAKKIFGFAWVWSEKVQRGSLDLLVAVYLRTIDGDDEIWIFDQLTNMSLLSRLEVPSDFKSFHQSTSIETIRYLDMNNRVRELDL